jgi:hypothetical protein
MKKTTGILAAAAVIGLWPALAQEPSPISINPKLPTVFVIGDSTASNVDHRGWADPFADYFGVGRRIGSHRRHHQSRSGTPHDFHGPEKGLSA